MRDMAGAAWATPEVLERLFRDSFDSKGFVREGAVPVLAKGTFAVVFKVRASARAQSPRTYSMKRCALALQKHRATCCRSRRKRVGKHEL